MNPESVRDLGYQSHLVFPAKRFKEGDLKAFANELEDRGVSHNRSAFQDNFAELVQNDGSTDELTRTIIKSDRLLLSHDNVQSQGFAIFSQKLEIIAQAAFEHLSVGVITNQLHTIQKLVTPKRGADARIFLLEKLCGIGADKRKVLKRPLHGAGLRLCFPITDRQDPFEYDVKIESYLRDGTLLYVQNSGKFHLPLVAQSLKSLTGNLDRTNEFLLGEIFDFLKQFNDGSGEGAKEDWGKDHE